MFERSSQVEVERLTERIWLDLIRAHLGDSAIVREMAAGTILEQALVNVAQRQLADSAHALGRQLHMVALLKHVAGTLQQHHYLAQTLEILIGLLAEQL